MANKMRFDVNIKSLHLRLHFLITQGEILTLDDKKIGQIQVIDSLQCESFTINRLRGNEHW